MPANITNVYFKRGHQSALETLKTRAVTENNVFQAGAFYLTDDTNRLYFAQTNNDIVELNQFIHVWSGASLPTTVEVPGLQDGDFYYWSNNNILAIYIGTGWVQINPDTRLKNTNSAVSIAGGSNAVSVTTTVEESNRNNNLTNGRTATGAFTVQGGSNVHITVNDQTNTITISADNDHATSYVISTTTGSNNTGNLHLGVEGEQTTQDIRFKGQDGVSVSSNNNGEITISAHSAVDSVENTFTNQGEFITQIGFVNNETPVESDGIFPTITYGEGARLESKKFIGGNGNPTAHLSVYSRDEIDAIFTQKEQEFDGLTYKGTVSSSNVTTKLATASNRAGNVYKASTKITTTNASGLLTEDANIGDLIIAEESGTAPNTTIVWNVVPSGNDQFIEITGNEENKALSFTDHFNGDSTLGSISFSEDTTATNAKINIIATGSGTDDREMNFQFIHGGPGTGTPQTYTVASGTRVQASGSTLTIPAISSISIDPQGHIASITTENYQVVDSHPGLQQPIVTTDDTNNVGTYDINLALTEQSNAGVHATLNLQSDNLKIHTVNNVDTALKVNLEWESF